MRVGQLARKLGISPTEVINFLSSVAIETPEASNTKLTPDQLQIAVKHFDPLGKLEAAAKLEASAKEEIGKEEIREEIKEQVIAAAEPVTASLEVTSAEIIDTVAEPETFVDPAPRVEEPSAENTTEVIKAPKVELAGLKVLGKIELPEKKKKDPPVETEPTENIGPPAPIEEQPRAPRYENRPRNPRHQGSRTDREASRKNPIALKREQEAAEAERKRQEEAKLAKERRTQHYLSKVKSVPTKPARLNREDVVELHIDNTKTPTTWLGKLWKWFRS